MDVAIFGTGYVGLVTGACLADGGNDVICVDVDEAKIASLRQGELPIYEPGLKDVVARNVKAGRLRFTTDAAETVAHGLFQFIAVGTPPQEDGSSDLQYVFQVARTIGDLMSDEKIVVTKSTVPVGTTDRVRALIEERLSERGVDIPFDVVSNPEFLKEGAAVEDFMRPDRIIVGTENRTTQELMHELYAPFNRNHNRLMTMDVRSAELTKYAANAMLATRISFMNELANIAERVGADIEHVRIGIGSDSRIGYDFIYAGAGYGGSCFPKDIRALERTAAAHGYTAQLLRAVEAVNDRQKSALFEKIMAHYDGNLFGRTFGVWGLAFKPNTDDMRDAPSRYLLESLWAAGASVRAHDPAALDEARRIWGDRPDLTLCEDPEEVVNGADALVIITEWRVFRSPDFEMLREALREPVIFDGRNIYDPARVAAEGFTYYGIGLGERVPELTSATLP
jgi:UDPglucose 6-dehydrogenase